MYQILTSSRSRTKKPAAATATKKAKTKRGPSIQALGHSYAAARPVRKCSEQNPYGWWGGGLQQMMQMYPCDQCEKTFPQPYRWVVMVQQTGERENVALSIIYSSLRL